MFDGDTYRKILNETIIPLGWPEEQQQAGYASLVNYIQNNLPEHLYWFRSCSERHLDQFYRDQLSFSVGTEMNDDFDARVYFNRSEVRHWLETSISQALNLNPSIGLENTLKFLNEKLNLNFSPAQIQEWINNISESVIKQGLQSITTYLLDNFDAELSNISHMIQGSIKFSCFCADVCSDIMWGHYANSATGFAVQYDFITSSPITYFTEDKKDRVGCDLYPILYGTSRINATDFIKDLFVADMINRFADINHIRSAGLMNLLLPNLDNFMATKIALNKSDEWSYEKEWRLFLMTSNEDIHKEKYTTLTYKPSGIYLGRKIRPLYQKILSELAKEKTIPVYKMDIDDKSNSYRLVYHQIQ